jgi:hypothetical protein
MIQALACANGSGWIGLWLGGLPGAAVGFALGGVFGFVVNQQINSAK